MDESKLSRRRLFALSGAAALQAACAEVIPPPGCCRTNPPELFPPSRPVPPDPLPGFTAERLRVWAFDEIHAVDATVHRPQSEAELVGMVQVAYRTGRPITLRGGGKSLGQQALGKTILLLDAPCFRTIEPIRRAGREWHLTCKAGARWGDIVRTLGDLGYVPRTVVTTGDATIGGTSVVDGVSRMSPLVGKEGEQIVRFKMIDGRGEVAEYADPGALEFRAAVAGFGAIGVMTEVTIKVARAIPGCRIRPDVETTATRYMPGTYDWGDLLRSLAADTTKLAAEYDAFEARYASLAESARAPELKSSAVIGISLVCWFVGAGLAVDRLESRYVHGEKGRQIPGGLYTEGSGFARFGEALAGYSQTVSQLISTSGFPNGVYVDELCGFLFFMGNSATPAVKSVRLAGARLNFTQQTYVVPTPLRPGGDYDVRLSVHFLFLVVERCRERDLRPFSVDLLHLQEDTALLSANRGLVGFAVTITFADHDAEQWPWIQETFMELSHDVVELGGRVHLVKNVEADVADLRTMYKGGFADFKKVKEKLDPRGIFTSELYDRYFAHWRIA